jgi:hypothetical protein
MKSVLDLNIHHKNPLTTLDRRPGFRVYNFKSALLVKRNYNTWMQTFYRSVGNVGTTTIISGICCNLGVSWLWLVGLSIALQIQIHAKRVSMNSVPPPHQTIWKIYSRLAYNLSVIKQLNICDIYIAAHPAQKLSTILAVTLGNNKSVIRQLVSERVGQPK